MALNMTAGGDGSTDPDPAGPGRPWAWGVLAAVLLVGGGLGLYFGLDGKSTSTATTMSPSPVPTAPPSPVTTAPPSPVTTASPTPTEGRAPTPIPVETPAVPCDDGTADACSVGQVCMWGAIQLPPQLACATVCVNSNFQDDMNWQKCNPLTPH